MQTEMNFETKSYACTFRVRKAGAIGIATDAHTEVVQADNDKAAWHAAITAINTAGVWDIMWPLKIERL